MTKETVLQGVVRSGGEPVPAAYVRLLDDAGEFVAEVQSSATGQFQFFAKPGRWTVRALSRQGSAEQAVQAQVGVTELDVDLE